MFHRVFRRHGQCHRQKRDPVAQTVARVFLPDTNWADHTHEALIHSFAVKFDVFCNRARDDGQNDVIDRTAYRRANGLHISEIEFGPAELASTSAWPVEW